jgi:putative oxidoreductase
MIDRALFLAARILIPSVFVGLGLERLLIFAGVIPGPPFSIGAAAFSAFELVAGLLVMVGWKMRWVAGLLAVFILVDAFTAHAFWTHPAAEQHSQLLHFLKNMSTLGGLLLLVWMDGKLRPDRTS